MSELLPVSQDAMKTITATPNYTHTFNITVYRMVSSLFQPSVAEDWQALTVVLLTALDGIMDLAHLCSFAL